MESDEFEKYLETQNTARDEAVRQSAMQSPSFDRSINFNPRIQEGRITTRLVLVERSDSEKRELEKLIISQMKAGVRSNQLHNFFDKVIYPAGLGMAAVFGVGYIGYSILSDVFSLYL